jgi:hypothetical protein
VQVVHAMEMVDFLMKVQCADIVCMNECVTPVNIPLFVCLAFRYPEIELLFCDCFQQRVFRMD